MAETSKKVQMDHIQTTHEGAPSDKAESDVKHDASQPVELSTAEAKRTRRKIDPRVVPIVTVLYLFSFLDRGNIGNAKVLGMADDLKLTDNRYNIAYMVFFFPYAFLEVPCNLLLKKFSPSIWLPSIMVAWGIICTLTGVTQSYKGLLAARVFLGVAESGQYPGVSYYLTEWYGVRDLGFRQGIFFSAAGAAGAFSGLLAYGIDQMDGVGGYEGWRWIFILEGLTTVAIGVAAFFIIVDSPDKAKFLTEDEKAWTISRTSSLGVDSNGEQIQETGGFQWKYVWRAFADWQIWLGIITDMASSCTIYGMSAFLPTIVKYLGYSGQEANLLTIPPYICACIMTIGLSWLSDRLQTRSPFVIGLLCAEFVGYSLALAGSVKNIHGLAYTGVFIAVMCCYPAFILIVTWLISNTAPSFKRACSTAVLVGIGNMSGPMGSNFYKEEQAPQFVQGHCLELMIVFLGICCAITLRVCYQKINAKREREMAEHAVGYTKEELSEMGDRAPTFRYHL